jgi:hypothetical protein
MHAWTWFRDKMPNIKQLNHKAPQAASSEGKQVVDGGPASGS